MRNDEQKRDNREYMRKRRTDPVYRELEYRRNAEYRKKHRPQINANVRRYRDEKRKDPKFRERESEQTRAAYVRLRTRLFEMYGSVCQCCGETERAFMELDHVNGGGGKHLTETSPVTVYRQILRAGYSAEYQLLCANCNRGRQRAGGICPHQMKPA